MRILGIAIGVAIAAAACSNDNSSTPAVSTNPTQPTGTEPTFTNVYTQVIGPVCGTCHGPGQIGLLEGNLDMSTQAAAFANTVNVPASGILCNGKGTRIVPGQPAESVLYLKL